MNRGLKRKQPQDNPGDQYEEGSNEKKRQGDSRYVVSKARPDEPEIEQPADAGVVPKVQFRWVLSGPSKSGKTNLARWVLDKYYKPTKGGGSSKSFFDRIYLLSPTAHIDYMWSDLPGLKDKDRHTRPTAKLLEKILNDQKREIQGNTADIPPHVSQHILGNKKKKAPKVLIMFDDAIAESKLINSPEFLKVFIQGRHYNISSMVMSQSYMKIPRSVRLQATHVSLFPSRSSEIERLYGDHGPKELNKKEFTELVQMATEPMEGDEYPFLYVDVFEPPMTRFRRNFTHVMEITGGMGEEAVDEEGGGGDAEDDQRQPAREALPPKRKRKRPNPQKQAA